MNRKDSVEMSFNLVSIKNEIDEFLLAYCRNERDKASQLHPNYRRLWDEIVAHVENGGKRLRPFLVVMAYESFGGKNRESIIRVASAWELIHVAVLMHDDIIDRDYVRHGHPNVAGSYMGHYSSVPSEVERRHFANSSALLAGDLLISASYELLFGSDFPARDIHGISKLLHDAIFTVVGGELLDVEASIFQTDADPRLIAEAKTASYSLIGPLLTGASLAGASEEEQLQLQELGLILGVGYQYVDDMLGVFGDEKITGKSATSDLEEGKRTFVVNEALQLMSSTDKERTEFLLAHPSAAGAMELRSLIMDTDVQNVMTNRIDDFHADAVSGISKLQLDGSHRAAFEDVVGMILKRKA